MENLHHEVQCFQVWYHDELSDENEAHWQLSRLASLLLLLSVMALSCVSLVAWIVDLLLLLTLSSILNVDLRRIHTFLSSLCGSGMIGSLAIGSVVLLSTPIWWEISIIPWVRTQNLFASSRLNTLFHTFQYQAILFSQSHSD